LHFLWQVRISFGAKGIPQRRRWGAGSQESVDNEVTIDLKFGTFQGAGDLQLSISLDFISEESVSAMALMIRGGQYAISNAIFSELTVLPDRR
jgi:hypothetical protein